MSKSTPKSCRLALISANISSTPSRRKTSWASSSGSASTSGSVGDDPGGDLADVRAAVPVLGRRLALGRGEQRAGEPVDLHAVVVEVVLPGRPRRPARPGCARASRRQPPSGCRPGASGRSGWPTRTPGSPAGRSACSVDPYAGPSVTMLRASSPAAAASRTMLRKPGPATDDALDPRHVTEPAGQQLGDLARWPPGRLGQLQGDVGGPVAVLADLRALHPYLARAAARRAHRPRRRRAGRPGSRPRAPPVSRRQATGAMPEIPLRLRPGHPRPAPRPGRSARPARTAWR